MNLQRKYSAVFDALYSLNAQITLTEEQAYLAAKNVLDIPDNLFRSLLFSNLLTGVMVKGAHLGEVVGLLRAVMEIDDLLPENKYQIDSDYNVIGYAGSGKKGIKTFNISTPSAIVAASCGAYIAKACSCSTSSLTGSSDFISEIGIPLSLTVKDEVDLLKSTHIAFFSMEKTTPKFAQLYEGRFYLPHALSYALAAVSLPIKTDSILYGFAHENIELSAKTLAEFGYKNILVVNSTEDNIHYVDELTFLKFLNICEISETGDSKNILLTKREDFFNEMHGNMYKIREMENEYENIRVSVKALCGKGDEYYIDLICANAGLILYLSHKCDSLELGYEIAKDSVKSGAVHDKVVEILMALGQKPYKFERFLN